VHQFTKKKLRDRVPGGDDFIEPKGLNNVIMQYFFPLNRNLIEKLEPNYCILGSESEVTREEVEKILGKCSNQSVPGLDQVLYIV
jgi:hypothetical protein